MKHWRILADDLTGALDTAAAFAGAQHVPVFLRHPGDTAAPVQAWATGSRDVPPGALPPLLQACLPWFTAPGHLAFKKVDSLLRGNSFAEVAWLLRHGGFNGVVFAPAYPAQGRFTVAGRHAVGQPDAPGTAHDPVDLLERLAQAGAPSLHLPDITCGLGQQHGVLVPDVRSDADLARIAQLSQSAEASRWLWCGSAGLAWALAQHGQLAPTASPQVPPGPTQLVTASRHPVLRAQLARLAHLGVPLHDLAGEQSLPAAEARAQLQQRSHTLVQNLPRPAKLVVVGGDTLLALCQAAVTHCLHAGASPRSGWGQARLQGGAWDGVSCYSRSGAFGAPDDLSALLATLTEKEHSP